ncbi:zinc-dependent metalloprotease [Allorhizocola rhizosphaerae]|uniref:zinc-dependent metalloprotease n=1 Tax=Allorhizocola rhizosphaerae TaxID=1872709 RepID=UPI001FEC6EE6|nr:zinc-dependent metalloprotease [Allorhizocola rhizosphaerae]
MPDTPFGFALPGGQPPDPNDPQQMQQFLAGLQQLMAAAQSGGSTGPVNWDLARQVATSALNSEGDPAVTAAERAEIGEALRLADLWLEPTTALPSGVITTAAWNRNEWIYNTMDVWRKLADPVAARMVAAMGDLVPPEARAQLGPMSTMITALGGALFGGQFGQALAKLATEVLSAGDIGLPLGPAGTAALLPANIRGYREGLELDPDEVRLFVALREAAHQRLFGHVPWLRGHVLTAVEAYARGIRVDREAIEEAMRRIDPSDPETMREIQLEGIFAQEDTEQQRAALNRLETALALVEGWVVHVVEAAAQGRLPNVVKLSEAFRRRRAAGGPAESTFAALVGLELRPRRLREAAALWTALTEHRGVSGRDALWGHPDLLPSEEDFADPDAFAQSQLDLGELEGFDGFDDFNESKGNDEGKDDNEGGESGGTGGAQTS